MPKYRVSWEVVTRCEIVVEASSEQEAEDMICNGEFDDADLEEDAEFSGVTMVAPYQDG